VSALAARLPDPIVGRLRRLDTSAVSDAMDTIAVTGVVTGISPIWPSESVAGRVIPIQLVPVGEAPPAPHHLGTVAIEAGGPEDVIVVDNRGRLEMGGWGGLLARGASARGIAGAIIDGACRDADEIQQIGFAAFARGTTARTARGRVVERIASQIEIGGVKVHAGDLVLADKTAVVFVPANRAEEIIEAAERIVARETAMASALARGLPATSVMGLDYEELLTRLASSPTE
jgi:4-hydroxy-4-methyl-2-oxoglutarate aldolase